MKSVACSIILVFIIHNHCMSQKMAETDLDFWIGNWNCFSSDSLIGQNVILKRMNNKVVEEKFMTYGDGFEGGSWNVFDSASAVWKQTWVDNSGAYMLFTGSKDEDTIFFTENNSVTLNGHKHYRRMIFYSIELNSFEWKWQSSLDRIKWKTNWHITYRRKLS